MTKPYEQVMVFPCSVYPSSGCCGCLKDSIVFREASFELRFPEGWDNSLDEVEEVSLPKIFFSVIKSGLSIKTYIKFV